MDQHGITQDDLAAVDPEWLAHMLQLAARGQTPEPEPRADSTLIQHSGDKTRKYYLH